MAEGWLHFFITPVYPAWPAKHSSGMWQALLLTKPVVLLQIGVPVAVVDRGWRFPAVTDFVLEHRSKSSHAVMTHPKGEGGASFPTHGNSFASAVSKQTGMKSELGWGGKHLQ